MPSEIKEFPERYRLGIFPVVAVIYFLSAELGHAISFPGAVATFWPPAGVSLAAYLYIPRRCWGHVLLGTICANLRSDILFHEKTILVSLGFWCANRLESIVAYFAIRWFCKGRRYLETGVSWYIFGLQSLLTTYKNPCARSLDFANFLKIGTATKLINRDKSTFVMPSMAPNA